MFGKRRQQFFQKCMKCGKSICWAHTEEGCRRAVTLYEQNVRGISLASLGRYTGLTRQRIAQIVDAVRQVRNENPLDGPSGQAS